MAKDVRWIIPFKNVKETIDYEIRIYDSYIGTKPASWPVTLQAGSEPIKTEEDASDDFFCPVRPSTGTIQVTDFDGTLMEQLIPANNTDRPVQLVRVNKSVTPQVDVAIEWQGFLSCEAYSQEYTAVAQLLSINIHSVLSAMDSDICKTTDFSGFVYINQFIKLALSKMVGYGATFSNIYFPKVNYSILNKYMNPIIMVDKKEKKTGNYITYIDDGKTLKEVLEIVCTFMGWCVRESGDSIIFSQLTNISYDSEKIVYNDYATYSSSNNFVPSETEVDMTTKNISTLIYRGDGHSKSISQGAKSVEVTAKISKMFNEKFEIPDHPNGTTYFKSYQLKSLNFLCARLCSNTSAYYGRISFMYYKGHGVRSKNRGYIESYDGRSNISMFISSNFLSFAWLANIEFEIGTTEYVYTGACFAKYTYADWPTPEPTLSTEAIFVNLLPLRDESYIGLFLPIFSMSSIANTVYNNGKFIIKADCDFLYLVYYYDAAFFRYATSVIKCDNPEEKDTHQLKVFFRVGTPSGYKYWNGDDWSDTQEVFIMEIHGSGFGVDGQGYEIPVNQVMSGYAEFAIYPEVGDRGKTSDILIAMMMKSLSVSFEFNNGTVCNEDSKNNYYRLLGYNFSEEINVETELVTDRGNKISPSTIYNDSLGTSKCTSIDYIKSNDITEQRISEVDLLDRLAKFYGKIRRRLELICEHPTEAALPLLQIDAKGQYDSEHQGYSEVLKGYDGKLYLPLAESRDWQQDTSTITCFETPDGDE